MTEQEPARFTAQEVPPEKTRIYNTRSFSMLLVGQNEVENLIEEAKKQQDQTDWLQIYCALISKTEENPPKTNIVDRTDLLYDLYQQRWQ